MKKLIIIAACTALAACGSKEEPAAEATEAAPAATTDTATASQMAGTYEVKLADGTVTRQTINADGTYADTDLNGTQLETGTWRQTGDQLCYDPEGEEPEACYTGGAPAPDGSFEVRDASGTVASTVRRVEANATAKSPAE